MGAIGRDDPEEPAGLGRRQFLVRAAVAGTVVWAVPSVITMEPAGAAELTSPPPKPRTVDVGGALDPGDPGDPPVAVRAAGTLPRTGADVDQLVAAGLAAAGGAALHIWSARAAQRSQLLAETVGDSVAAPLPDPTPDSRPEPG